WILLQRFGCLQISPAYAMPHLRVLRPKCFFPLGTFLALLACAGLHGAQPAAEADAPEVFGKVYHCKPGPWGDLEYYYIYLEAPDRLVEHFALPHTVTKWVFPGGTEAEIRKLFQTAGLSSALQQYLLDAKHRVN